MRQQVKSINSKFKVKSTRTIEQDFKVQGARTSRPAKPKQRVPRHHLAITPHASSLP